VCFENDPDQCLINATERADGRDVTADIRSLSAAYSIPDEAIVQPVYKRFGFDP
jgi:hypothetical protein